MSRADLEGSVWLLGWCHFKHQAIKTRWGAQHAGHVWQSKAEKYGGKGKKIPLLEYANRCSTDSLLQEIALHKQRNLGLKCKGVSTYYYLNNSSHSSKHS